MNWIIKIHAYTYTLFVKGLLVGTKFFVIHGFYNYFIVDNN